MAIRQGVATPRGKVTKRQLQKRKSCPVDSASWPQYNDGAVEWPKCVVVGNTAKTLFGETGDMAEGTIKRLTDKGFGFISTGGDKDIFFHMSDLEGVAYEELGEGQRVSFNEGRGPKGPRAENVKPI
jgi:CspA family cold shock protein